LSDFGFQRVFTSEQTMSESGKLLKEYASSRSEAAFRELVERYVNLVHSVALRLAGGDSHLAEDVTQIVFADLAAMAPKLPEEVLLGGWLHQHTCFVTNRTLRTERRRRIRERQAVEMNSQQDHTEANLARIAPILDEAIGQLGTSDRTAIILRYFEQYDLRSVGEALGTTEDGAQKRVSRALEKLHVLLKHRSATLSAVALGTALATEAVTAAPAGLAGSVAGIALANAAAAGGTTLTLLKIAAVPKLTAGIIGVMVLAGIFTLLMKHRSKVAIPGYEATGYLTYTGFGVPGHTYKQVMMFNVKVAGTNWLIHTEPVLDGEGKIGFYEASSGTNGSVLKLTGLESPYPESQFQALRTELKLSKKDDVFFPNVPVTIPPQLSNSVRLGRSKSRDSVNNVAVATFLKGKYPPADPSYAALLWFAFTPPSTTNGLLPEIWDDGNPKSFRFRRAHWKQFEEPPQAISSASFEWPGEELLPDGTQGSIYIADITTPLKTSARYAVNATTNVSGLILPLGFTLTRFDIKWSNGEDPRVVSTAVASVTKVSRFVSKGPLDVKLSGKTLVQDYRGGFAESPYTYILYPNSASPVSPLDPTEVRKRSRPNE
jgi:RNA polymerase sigma factor (sigma-70 family)